MLHFPRLMKSPTRTRWVSLAGWVVFGVAVGLLVGWGIMEIRPGVPAWLSGLVIGAVVSLAINVKYWVEGWLGLDQWPNPHGRYYNRWLELSPGAADYYEWLAREKANRKPGQSWARKKELPEQRD